MSLRLDPNDPEVRKMLENRGHKEDLKKYFSSKKDKAHITHRIDDKTMTEKTASSRKNKYGNIKETDIESGLIFDSRWELHCYRTLKNLKDKKLIFDLKTQVKIPLEVEGILICNLICDFQFEWNNNLIYADAKSTATSPVGFRIKLKLFEALYRTKLNLIIKDEKSIIEKINGEL